MGEREDEKWMKEKVGLEERRVVSIGRHSCQEGGSARCGLMQKG